MAVYLLTLPEQPGLTLKHGADQMIVQAASATQAKEMAQAKFDGDGSTWTGATATELASTADFEGWKFDISLYTSTPKHFTYTGTSANDTIDEIGAALVTLINADADIANAAYNTTSNTLTVAGTADGLGDKELIVKITPPSGTAPIASLVGTITDGGATDAAVSVILPTSDTAPAVLAWCKSV